MKIYIYVLYVVVITLLYLEGLKGGWIAEKDLFSWCLVSFKWPHSTLSFHCLLSRSFVRSFFLLVAFLLMAP